MLPRHVPWPRQRLGSWGERGRLAHLGPEKMVRPADNRVMGRLGRKALLDREGEETG